MMLYFAAHWSAMPFPAGFFRSINDGCMIRDRETFENYPWPNPDDFDYSRLELIEQDLPQRMKLIPMGPGGVLENVIDLVGYESLCYMMVDDRELVMDIFEAVGSRLNRYYEIVASYPSVGALVSNDDWGFKTQTMLSPADMRHFVLPWHEQIVATIHRYGKPAILHSCGNLESVMDDIIDGIKYDAKHSYEDTIIRVEDAYERWGHRIAILGGIDLDFLCRSSPREIRERSEAMLKRTVNGGYALGSGNSIPAYVPKENYYAMIAAVNEMKESEA